MTVDVPRNVVMEGDALRVLRSLPDGCVDACITSPPYWGLRAYGTAPQVWPAPDRQVCIDGCQFVSVVRRGTTGGTASPKVRIKGTENFQIVPDRESATCARCGAWRGELGSEPEPEAFTWHLVLIFREVRRVLKRTGTAWLNLGDSYYSNPGGGSGTMTTGNKPAVAAAGRQRRVQPHAYLKAKDLCLLPFQVAMALQRDGWWLRSWAPWLKRNALPESTVDRPSTSLECWFQFAKAPRYYYDWHAVRKDAGMAATGGTRNRRNGDWWYESLETVIEHQRAYLSYLEAIRANGGVLLSEGGAPLGLDVVTAAFPGAHFATFPPNAVRPLVRSSTSERGVCPACGAPWERLPTRHRRSDEVWQPTCRCDAGAPIPALVLDPFMGAGTTAIVALQEGRAFLGVELNPEYAAMARRRIQNETGFLRLINDPQPATTPEMEAAG